MNTNDVLNKLIAEIERQQRRLIILSNTEQVDMKRDCALQNGAYCYILDVIKSLQQEQPTKGYDEAYLNECIAKASKTWKGVDTDKYMDEVRGVEQEQPEPTCKSCGFYENNCPFIRNTFKLYPNRVCKDYTYSVMKEQEQPEVDLDDVIENYILENFGERWDGCVPVSCFELNMMANHFYKLGRFNARKEE